jgi:hypothetical protein
MVRLIRRTVRPQRISENTPAVFSNMPPRICPHLLFLATKDYSDRLLGASGRDRKAKKQITADLLATEDTIADLHVHDHEGDEPEQYAHHQAIEDASSGI